MNQQFFSEDNKSKRVIIECYKVTTFMHTHITTHHLYIENTIFQPFTDTVLVLAK